MELLCYVVINHTACKYGMLRSKPIVKWCSVSTLNDGNIKTILTFLVLVAWYQCQYSLLHVAVLL